MRNIQIFWHLSRALLDIWRPILRPLFMFIGLFVCSALFAYFVLPFLGNLIFSLSIFNPIEQIVTPQTEITTNTLPLNKMGSWFTKGRVEHILITKENTVALGVFSFDGHKLVVFNIETGEFFWKKAGNMGSLDVDQERVYVGMVSNVHAYNLKTGEFVFEYKQSSKGRGSLHVFAEGDKIKVYKPSLESNFISTIYTLDAQTGELLDTDNNLGSILPPDYDWIYRTTANTNFEYIIEADGRIVGIDNRTGQEIGYLEMTSPSVYDKVVVSDEFLVVYNDNNQELLVFK